MCLCLYVRVCVDLLLFNTAVWSCYGTVCNRKPSLSQGYLLPLHPYNDWAGHTRPTNCQWIVLHGEKLGKKCVHFKEGFNKTESIQCLHLTLVRYLIWGAIVLQQVKDYTSFTAERILINILQQYYDIPVVAMSWWGGAVVKVWGCECGDGVHVEQELGDPTTLTLWSCDLSRDWSRTARARVSNSCVTLRRNKNKMY